MTITYEEAIGKIVKENKSILGDSFLVYSLLSDYIGACIIEKELLRIYFEVSKRHNLYEIITNYGISTCRDLLANDFKKHNYYCQFSDLKKTIDPICKALFPDEFENLNKIKVNIKEQKKAVVIRKDKNVDKKENTKKQNIKRCDLKTSIKYDDLNVKVKAKEFKIELSKDGKTKLFSVLNNVRNLINRNINVENNTLFVEINDPYNEYVLSIPYKRYKNGKFVLKSTDIININNSTSIEVENLTILMKGGDLKLNAESTNLSISGTTPGDVYLNGCYGNLNIKRKFGHVFGKFNFKNGITLNSFNCKIDKGNIDVTIPDIKSSIGCKLFEKRKVYIDVQDLGYKLAMFSLTTKEGVIHIRK